MARWFVLGDSARQQPLSASWPATLSHISYPATFFDNCAKLSGLGSSVMIVALGKSMENWSAA